MSFADAALVSVILLIAFLYHSLGAFLILGRVQLSEGLRAVLLPRPVARGLRRTLSVVWVVSISVLSQLIAIGAVANLWPSTSSYLFATELLLAATWIGLLKYRWPVVRN